MNKEIFDKAKKNFLIKEHNLSKYATLDKDAIRYEEIEDSVRSNFFRDQNRIIHSASYTRYQNKTQVHSFFKNDHISTRSIHVQLVSQIARTISRALKLNEDLTEAISLSHDIGHTPLGHVGESILNEISQRELNEFFGHNIQGVRNYLYLEKSGKGLNLTVQVLDGILCHNGEMLSNVYEPKLKTKEKFLEEYNNCYKGYEYAKKVRPMTLEGCVVRISDIIGYVGRDIEDAIKLNKLSRDDIPDNIKEILGTTNQEIVDTLITDIMENSLDKPYIKMSDEVFLAIKELKKLF